MRKVVLILAIIIISALTWYLFVRPYDVAVNFSVKTVPGTVNQTLKKWNGFDKVKQESQNTFTQQATVNKTDYQFVWKVSLLNDSTSNIKVAATEPGRSILNRLLIPFTRSEIEINTLEVAKSFRQVMKEHLKKFRVVTNGEDVFPKKFCAYVSISSVQAGKANGMMSNYGILSSFIVSNGLKTDGVPIIETTYWDPLKDSINFNLCYPIVQSDSLPEDELIRYKWIDESKSLKATYFGNYITSDRAWYVLLEEAERTGRQTTKLPIEVFYNNPHFDSNESEWKAEIFLPLK